MLGSLRSLTFRLWDERRNRLVSFGQLKALRPDRQQAGGGR